MAEPYVIAVPDCAIAELKDRLTNIILPDEVSKSARRPTATIVSSDVAFEAA